MKFNDFNFEDNTYKLKQGNVKGKKELTFNMDEYLLDAVQSQARVTITKILKEALFSFLTLIFISYAYLNSYVISNEGKYHNVIAYFTLLTESRYVRGYRV